MDRLPRIRHHVLFIYLMNTPVQCLLLRLSMFICIYMYIYVCPHMGVERIPIIAHNKTPQKLISDNIYVKIIYYANIKMRDRFNHYILFSIHHHFN